MCIAPSPQPLSALTLSLSKGKQHTLAVRQAQHEGQGALRQILIKVGYVD